VVVNIRALIILREFTFFLGRGAKATTYLCKREYKACSLARGEICLSTDRLAFGWQPNDTRLRIVDKMVRERVARQFIVLAKNRDRPIDVI